VPADLVDRADVRVVQCRRGFGLALEATEGLRVLGYIFWQEFERDEATQVGVLGLIDDTHASPAELLGQRDSGRLSGQSFVARRH
jgi:hypothetical protein